MLVHQRVIDGYLVYKQLKKITNWIHRIDALPIQSPVNHSFAQKSTVCLDYSCWKVVGDWQACGLSTLW